MKGDDARLNEMKKQVDTLAKNFGALSINRLEKYTKACKSKDERSGGKNFV